MGTRQSKPDNSKPEKIHIIMDLHFKMTFGEMNIDDLKTNDCLKRKLRNIILTALVTKGNYNVELNDSNLWLVSKTDKNNTKYLELNAIVYFYESNLNEISDDLRRIKKMKFHIVGEFYTYTSSKCNIDVSPNAALILLYNTLYNISVQKYSRGKIKK